MKVSFCLITFVTTTNIVWSAVSRPRASAGGGVRPDTTVGVDQVAGGGTSPGTKGSVGQGPGTTVGISQRAGGGASPGATVGVGQGARGGASSGATLGVDLEPGTIVGISQGAGGGASPGTTVGVGHGAGGGVRLGTKGSVGQGPGAIAGLSQGAGGGASSNTTVGLDRGARDGASQGTTVGVGHGAGGGASPGTTVGVGQVADGGASLGTTVGAGHGGGGGATLSKGGSGVVDASLGAGSSTGLATNFSSGADAVLATLTTRMRKINPKKNPKKNPPGKTKKITKLRHKKKPIKKNPIRKLCESKGFAYPKTEHPNWCVCNFAGACDEKNTALKSTDLTTLKGFAPQGVDAFKYGGNSPVTICEGSTVGILYDCDALIPLYAATVIYGAYAGGMFTRTDNWVYSKDIKLQPSFVANKKDYDKSSCIVNCYEDEESGTFKTWDDSLCIDPKTPRIPSTTSIDRGHMIAATYGFGHGQTVGVDATFTYTNAVPQIGSFNRGSWSKAEKGVIELAKRCHDEAQLKNTKYVNVEARVYVVVGVIPTSFFDQPRFFGSAKFSNFQDDVYRVLLPEIMWTAVCCTHTDGTIPGKTAFYGHNSETNHQVKYNDSASDMFKEMQKTWPTIPTITVFPRVPDCN